MEASPKSDRLIESERAYEESLEAVKRAMDRVGNSEFQSKLDDHLEKELEGLSDEDRHMYMKKLVNELKGFNHKQKNNRSTKKVVSKESRKAKRKNQKKSRKKSR